MDTDIAIDDELRALQFGLGAHGSVVVVISLNSQTSAPLASWALCVWVLGCFFVGGHVPRFSATTSATCLLFIVLTFPLRAGV